MNYDPNWIGEPELKWCESILTRAIQSYARSNIVLTIDDYRALLRVRTNLSDIRIDRAIKLLRKQGRI